MKPNYKKMREELQAMRTILWAAGCRYSAENIDRALDGFPNSVSFEYKEKEPPCSTAPTPAAC